VPAELSPLTGAVLYDHDGRRYQHVDGEIRYLDTPPLNGVHSSQSGVTDAESGGRALGDDPESLSAGICSDCAGSDCAGKGES
jgi:hypothetical protein